MTIEEIIQTVADKLGIVPGVEAIVLGGSRATGTADEHSDIDIGIYYDAGTLSIERLLQAAKEIDPAGEIAKPGDWGPWINGGGWLNVGGVPTDLLLRDIEKVERVVTDCIEGRITIDYQCGHPFGFINSIYAAETASCRILFDRNGRITALKHRLSPYPEEMRRAMTAKFLWEAGFSLQCGEKSVNKRDFVNAAGSIYRCVVSLLQVLAADNGMFLLNEKGALKRVLGCPRVPVKLEALCEAAFAGLSRDEKALARSFDAVRKLSTEVKRLTEERDA